MIIQLFKPTYLFQVISKAVKCKVRKGENEGKQVKFHENLSLFRIKILIFSNTERKKWKSVKKCQ